MSLARDPEKCRAWQQRSAAKARKKAAAKKPKPAKPRKAIAKSNPKRQTKLRLAQFGPEGHTKKISEMPCVCGRQHPECTGGPSDPSHIVSRGAGGTVKDIVPKSRGCHLAWHANGRETYLAAIGWTWERLRELADRIYAERDGTDRGAPW